MLEIDEYDVDESLDAKKRIEAVYFKVPRQAEETVRAEIWNLQWFYDLIHYHKEYQITFILESDGILFIGDSVIPFHKDELFVIGKNIHHVFRHDKVYYEGTASHHAKAISIFFNSDTFEDMFKRIPEFFSIEKLIGKAKFGIKLERHQAAELKNHIKKVLSVTGMERVLELLNILYKISLLKNIQVLMSKTPMILEPDDNQKIDKVFNYLMDNYMGKITLETVAELVNLSPNAFCRYFKGRTQKTFSRFLIEVRISKACKVLFEGKNVAEACYLSGYNNISNFHRYFKQITGMTPNEYKKKIFQRK
ncbi:HTH-type transcriptional activator Btr [subsurface metagenome]